MTNDQHVPIQYLVDVRRIYYQLTFLRSVLTPDALDEECYMEGFRRLFSHVVDDMWERVVDPLDPKTCAFVGPEAK